MSMSMDTFTLPIYCFIIIDIYVLRNLIDYAYAYICLYGTHVACHMGRCVDETRLPSGHYCDRHERWDRQKPQDGIMTY